MAKRTNTNVSTVEGIRRSLQNIDSQIDGILDFQSVLKETGFDSILPAPVEVSGGIASAKAGFTNIIVTDRKGDWQRFGAPANGEVLAGDLSTKTGFKWDGRVTDHDTVMPFYDGASRDTISIIVVQNGAGVDLHLEADGGGDLRFRFDNVEYTLDTTPALVIPLNVGTDTVPVENYIYVTESGGTLSVSVSTSEFPETPHAKIATVDVQSAASVGTDGPYEVHAHTDHVVTASGNGHLDHINEKLRSMHATWLSGVAPADLVVVTTDGYLSIPTGKVRQLHKHTVPARDMQTGDPAFVINEPGTPYNRITSLASITQDSEGNTVTNKYINLVLWGVVSQVQADCKMFLSLPSGVYVTEANAIIDAEHTANYSIPTKYTGTAFMIARYTLKRSGSNVWSQSAKEDLRGLFPSTTAGGGSVSGEANTASNVGAGGVGVFARKTSVDLEFKNINAGSSKITVTDDTGDDEIDIDLGSVAITDLSDVSAKTGTGSTVVMDTSPTLTTPVLALPTISGSAFANAQHTHQAASAGGKLDHGAALNGLGDDDHTQYLLADGTRNMGGNFFIVDSFGFVIGHTSKIDFGATPEFQVLGTNTSDASMGFARFEDNTSGPDVRFLKSRAAAIGDNVIVQDGDTLGRFRFQGADGVDFNTTAAEVLGQVDGAPSENDIPGRIIFKTRIDDGALTEKMRLDNQGRLGIGTTPATSALLDLASTTGAILIPRMTTAQRDALTAVNAMMIYNSTLNKFQSYENSDWVTMIGGGSGDVVGPASATNNAIVRFDTATGKLVQNSGIIVDDSDNVSGMGTLNGRTLATDATKLDTIETSATADQTDAEIATAVEAATDSNTFTDADHTKLNGIETAAEVNVMQSITITPQMRSGGTAKPTLIGTTVGEEWRASLMSLNDTWICEVWLPTGYGGGGVTTKIFGSMVSGTSDKAKFELSLERMGTTTTIQNLHGASGFATAQNSGDVTVPGTAGDPFFSTVTNASGAEMDSTVAGERFRLKLKRITATGTDATGDFEFGGMLLDEQ